MNLTLGDQVKAEVSNSYTRPIKINGQAARIVVPNFYSGVPLHNRTHGKMTSLAIPLDPQTRSRFEELDTFARANANGGTYKELWKGEMTFINLSRWCKYEMMQPNGLRHAMPTDTILGKGSYSVVIEASHMYFGPHKNGETCSVSLYIVELLYQPEQDCISDFIDEILSAPPSPPPTAPVRNTSCRRTVRRPKRKNKDDLDEVDTPMPSVQ